MSIVLDTNALIWLLARSDRIGAQAVRHVDNALHADRVLISAASVWEVAILVAKKRVRLEQSVEQWRIDALQLGIEEVPMDGDLAIEAVALADLHPDPGDRFIVATAIRMRATLVTSDARLLAWKGPLACIDARV
jgi:PIN domain nuclease of toxin-antitoxin system